jgi:hypothetical protein
LCSRHWFNGIERTKLTNANESEKSLGTLGNSTKWSSNGTNCGKRAWAMGDKISAYAAWPLILKGLYRLIIKPKTYLCAQPIQNVHKK